MTHHEPSRTEPRRAAATLTVIMAINARMANTLFPDANQPKAG